MSAPTFTYSSLVFDDILFIVTVYVLVFPPWAVTVICTVVVFSSDNLTTFSVWCISASSSPIATLANSLFVIAFSVISSVSSDTFMM